MLGRWVFLAILMLASCVHTASEEALPSAKKEEVTSADPSPFIIVDGVKETDRSPVMPVKGTADAVDVARTFLHGCLPYFPDQEKEVRSFRATGFKASYEKGDNDGLPPRVSMSKAKSTIGVEFGAVMWSHGGVNRYCEVRANIAAPEQVKPTQILDLFPPEIVFVHDKRWPAKYRAEFLQAGETVTLTADFPELESWTRHVGGIDECDGLQACRIWSDLSIRIEFDGGF